MYWCDWTLELPVIVNDVTIAWCPDVDCRFILTEAGDLWKVRFPTDHGDVTVMSGLIFDCALEVMERDGDRIRFEAEVPRPKHGRPEHSGPEYHPVGWHMYLDGQIG